MCFSSFKSSGAKGERFIWEINALLQASFVCLKGMIRAGRNSLLMRLSKMVEAPQKLQNSAADVSVLRISPAHWGQVNMVASKTLLSSASFSLVTS